MSERDIRKQSSKQMKNQIKGLQDQVDIEKKNLSDKVSAQLDSTLKQAVREKVEVSVELQKSQKEKLAAEKQYQELQDMYNNLKDNAKASEALNEES